MRIIATICLGIMLVAPACSSEKDAPEKEAKASPQETFLTELHREYPNQNAMTDDQMVEFAKAGCQALDEGSSVEDIFGIVALSEKGPEFKKVAAESLSEGIAAFCPKHSAALVNAANTM